MVKFNKLFARRSPTSPVVSERTPSGVTFEGGPGYARDAKSELFLLAVTNMVGEHTFYEPGGARDERFAELVRQVAVDDPEWTARLLRWLRTGANMRTASLVGAAEFVKARLDAGADGGVTNRSVVDGVLQRADEPGELLAYWMAVHGRAVPKPVKRGVADAVLRLYDERALVKWDSVARAVRFGDVLNLVHPPRRTDHQADLFRHALDRRYGRDAENGVPPSLSVLTARAELMAWPTDRRTALFTQDRDAVAATLRAAGMTWESVAGWLQGPMTAHVWEALVPSMGYMACLAAGTPVWLADGTTAPIEDVVARRLPVLSYDKSWDTRPVEDGAGAEPRDRSVGNLVPTIPSAWLDTGIRPVVTIRFASGRVVEATHDHRWVRQRRTGRPAWEWTTSDELRAGDRIPLPLTAGCFGDEGDAWDGYFVGAMLGNGGTTASTPEFHGDPDDGAVAFMREYAEKYGGDVDVTPDGHAVRLRFLSRQGKPNPVTEVLRAHGVWGTRPEAGALPNRPFSRAFWTGVLSGLIDTDGSVRMGVDTKGTVRGSVGYATVSRRLAHQVSDALLRLGVTSVVKERSPRASTSGVHAGLPVHVVEVDRAAALVRLATVLDLRTHHKATALARVVEAVRHVAPAAGEVHGDYPSVALDRVVSVEDGGERPTYCVNVEPSNLFVAGGLITGNCLRNLRNLDEAGVSDDVAAGVAARIADPDQVARSRQLPMRFLSAYRAAPSLRWAWALEQAITHSLANVPELGGRTLVLVDTSGSMGAVFSKDGTLRRWDAAVVFGLALAARCAHADVVSFSNAYNGAPPTKVFPLRPRESLLKAVSRWNDEGYFLGVGTDTAHAVRTHLRRGFHDRVVILTDEQAADGDVGAAVPADVPLYTWNLAGHRHGHSSSGGHNRHTFGGLSDQAFAMIPLLEAGRNADWPF